MKHNIKGSIAKRLSTWFLLLTWGTAFAVGVTMFLTFEAVHRDYLFKNLSGIADKKIDQVSRYYAERIQDIEGASTSSTVQGAMSSFAQALKGENPDLQTHAALVEIYNGDLQQYLERSEFDNLFLINLEGKVLYSATDHSYMNGNGGAGLQGEPGQIHLYENVSNVAAQAIEQLGTAISFFKFDSDSNSHVAFFATPIMYKGEMLGVIALRLAAQTVTELITDVVGLGRTGEIIAVMGAADQGMMLAVPLRSNPTAAFSRFFSTEDEEYFPLTLALNGQQGQGVLKDFKKQKAYVVWRYLPYLNWGMMVKVNASEGMSAVNSVRQNLMLFGVFGGIAILFIASWIALSITRPLERLTVMAGEVAGGNFKFRAQVERSDEVGGLASAFNTMADHLRDTLDKLRLNQLELEQRVDERTFDLQDANDKLLLMGAVVDHTSEGVLITDNTGIIVELNQAYCKNSGYSRDELLGQSVISKKSDKNNAEFYTSLWADLKDHGHWRGEILDQNKNSEVNPRYLTINALYDEDDKVTHYVGVFLDISDLKQAERQLETLAYYDPLTELPNRSLLRDRLKQEISSVDRSGKKLALMLIDLDHFKYVNDTLGHLAGDDLLRLVAGRMLERVRDTDTVARLGGDEFSIVLSDLTDLTSVGQVAQKIITSLAQPFTLEGQEVYIGASIGISVYPEDAHDLETLSKNADMAMYRSKDAGRGQYHFFHNDMDLKANLHLKMESNLRRALIQSEFVVYYQPKVNLKDNTIVGMEALVRWIDPEEGLISPDEFIPQAEANGIIILIDQFVLTEACRELRTWREKYPDLRMAVNLSALQFKQPDLVDMIESALVTHDLPPHALELEITESTIMEDPEGGIELMEGLRKLGVFLSIDDFGTGYSSLAYLKKFPVNTLKIDKTFVADLAIDTDDAAIVHSVVSLAHHLNLGVVAEGIETLEQQKFLVEHNCETGQGYFFAKPVPQAEMTALLKKGLGKPGF